MVPGLAAFDIQVQSYQNSPHLTFTQFAGPIGGGVGVNSFSYILDESYTPKVALRPMSIYHGQQLTQDLHEFQVVGAPLGATALMTSYVTIQENVTYTACAGSPATQFTKTGLLSEISTDGKNTTLFSWSASDHIDPRNTYVCPGDFNVGSGKSAEDGFDFL